MGLPEPFDVDLLAGAVGMVGPVLESGISSAAKVEAPLVGRLRAHRAEQHVGIQPALAQQLQQRLGREAGGRVVVSRDLLCRERGLLRAVMLAPVHAAAEGEIDQLVDVQVGDARRLRLAHLDRLAIDPRAVLKSVDRQRGVDDDAENAIVLMLDA